MVGWKPLVILSAGTFTCCSGNRDKIQVWPSNWRSIITSKILTALLKNILVQPFNRRFIQTIKKLVHLLLTKGFYHTFCSFFLSLLFISSYSVWWQRCVATLDWQRIMRIAACYIYNYESKQCIKTHSNCANHKRSERDQGAYVLCQVSPTDTPQSETYLQPSRGR